jgi:hypothetical protein
MNIQSEGRMAKSQLMDPIGKQTVDRDNGLLEDKYAQKECFLFTFFTDKLKPTIKNIFKNGDQVNFLTLMPTISNTILEPISKSRHSRKS